MEKIKCYIAGPFFKEGERERIEQLREFFKSDSFFDKYEFFFPMDHKIPGGETMPNGEWAWNVFEMDVKELANSKLVIAIYDKHYSDSGTAWELGFAYANHIPVLLLCTDLEADNSIMPLIAADRIYQFNKFVKGEYFNFDEFDIEHLK
ncbi:MAG: nucleoside 2-deoxyribosyltransferase [Clostridiales bacterium]|nr:nucleoside 2-deoxyribosyltransferase [Clostridiales bacterium]